MLELLSPAGSFDSLRAAVCNGADAVYLGVESFNARRGARNFTLEELPEAVRYCHVHGVKVHLTLNVLVTDRELPMAAQVITGAARAGVDALIVQDFGIVALCRLIAPNLPLHASTQMSLHSLEGVRQAEALGLSRVVLARELPRDEIAKICRSTSLEIEVFAHGALCMCYSGQCYLSSVIGRRSGNRGQCAQPCRLPYGYDRFEEKYPLSLKDNCLLAYLRDLEQLGVRSIKLEGRMKRPEYVAVVTGIYRRVLNGEQITKQMVGDLDAAFSRQGFTQGYYLGQKGEAMFGVHTDRERTRTLYAAARESYETVEPQTVPVRFYAVVSRGEPVKLAVEDDLGNVCKAEGEIVVPAVTHALTAEELEARLAKTGGTPYRSIGTRCVIDPDSSVSAAELNRLRRQVLVQLSALRGRIEPPALGVYRKPLSFTGTAKPPVLTVSVRTAKQITQKLLRLRPAMLYVPISELIAQPAFFQPLTERQPIAAILPRVTLGSEQTKLLGDLDTVKRMGVKRALVGNLGQIAPVQSRGMDVAGDFGLNLFNSYAMALPSKLGLVSATASFELSLPQLRDLSKPLPTELLIYGRLPLMLMENCRMKSRAGVCACHTDSTRLIDRLGEEFRIVRDCDTCRSVLLNGKKLYLLDKKEDLRALGFWALRLSFTTENTAEVDGVLSAWQGGGSFDPGACTRGLYLRGVE